MAYVEPMDVDHIGNDFDDKENSILNSNVLPTTPCTEKGYEELDVSELNMKLRYSITPASSPMSKSYTTNYKENKIMNQDDFQNITITNENCNLSRSLNSTLTKCDTVSKSPKLPLQVVSNEQFLNSTMSSCMRRSIDTDANNITITVSETDNLDENLSLPSTSSSLVHTPEAITPTKDISKGDGGSPIMRGLKSVLNMFRSSQSPIPPEELPNKDVNLLEAISKDITIPPTTLASTPISSSKNKECNSSKRNSPLKDSVIFNDDLEKELQWKEETTIIFKQEKIPIQKLLFQQPPSILEQKTSTKTNEDKYAVEYMDISYNESILADKTMTEIENKTTSNIVETTSGIESDSEFVDCETTYTKNEQQLKTELNSLISNDDEMNKMHNVCHSSAVEKAVNEECVTKYDDDGDETNNVKVTVDVKDNEIRSEEINETITILPDILNATDIIHNGDRYIGDEKCVTEDIVSHNMSLNITDNTCMLSEVENYIPVEIHDNDHIQVQNNVISEISSTQEQLKDIINVKENDPQSKLEIEEECNPHDVTKPLNIITDYPNNENINSLDNYINNNDVDDNTLPKGLLKRYDIKDIIKKEIIHDNNDEINNITINKDNNMNITMNLSHELNERISLGTTDNSSYTILPNIEEKVLKEDLIDISSKHITETKIEESTDNIINKREIIHDNNDDINNIAINKDNDIKLTVNLSHVSNEIISLGSTDNSPCTILPNIEEKVLKDDFVDVSSIHITETNIKESTDNMVNDVSINCEIKCDVICDGVNSSFQNPVSLDIPFNNTYPNTIEGTNTGEINKEESNDERMKIQEVQEILDEINSAPSDCPLPCDDDVMDIQNLKENLDNEVDNVKNDNINDMLREIPNTTFPDMNINSIGEKNIISDVVELSNDIANKTVEITDSTKQLISEILPDHFMIPDNTNVNTFINDSNGNMQFLGNTDSENQEQVSIDNHKIESEMDSPPHTISCDNEINNLHNDFKPERIENPFETKTKLQQSPPISPKLSRNGYNINFDEIDDPFATKTAIRTSPPPETTISTAINHSQKQIEQKRTQMQNRRKSQPERKKQNFTKKPFNKSFESGLTKRKKEDRIDISKETSCDNAIIKIDEQNASLTDEVIAQPVNDVYVDNSKDLEEEKIITKEIKIDKQEEIEDKVSEIESAKNSITNTINKSVFNLPEIDNVNFNPFATKPKIRQSPPPLMTQMSNELNVQTESQSECCDITINMENIIQYQKQTSPSTSSIDSPNHTNVKDSSTQEVKTEDEDTVEGPFFEADDLTETENQSEFQLNHDDMPFEDFPIESNTDKKEELFIDAEAFEFLLNQNKSNVVADSGKESLFLKFDPLFAKRVSSDGVLSALNRIQKRQTTPVESKAEKFNETVEPTASSTARNVSEEAIDETNITTSKPMMVVNPAVNSLVSPRKSMTPPRVNRRSLTFTSPAMAVIDRLLSLSGNTSLLDHDTSIPQPTRGCNDTDIALTQLRELLAEKEMYVHNLRSETKELKERLAAMESQVRTLEKESEDRLKKVNDLNDRLIEKTKMNKSMAVVVEEYERTIASLIADMDQEKRRNAEERAILISERDEQTAHLASMEVSFSDLHSKYEKSKQIILSMKANEDTYKKSIKEFEDNLLKMQNNYELLKQHATSKLNHANQELEKFNRSHEAEVLKMNAMIKRKELHITSLEESLTQKTKANEELTAICDELINKVG